MKVKGFTLVELLIVITIITITLAISAPSFTGTLSENRLTTQYNLLVAAIALTRSEAIKRGQRVTICQSSDNASCTKASSEWHKGWAIFVDHNENNQIDNAEPILRVQSALSELVISFGARTRIAYHANGIAVGGSNGTVLLCDHPHNAKIKGLVISSTGRVRKASKSDLTSKTCPT